jgi:hypothetical protein
MQQQIKSKQRSTRLLMNPQSCSMFQVGAKRRSLVGGIMWLALALTLGDCDAAEHNLTAVY